MGVLSLLDSGVDAFVDKITEASKMLDAMPFDKKIEALNAARKVLSSKSPFKNHPVDCVQWVKTDSVDANDYNPNHVATPEMKLLELSIREDGYTMPAVTMAKVGGFELVDGAHRTKIAQGPLKKELHGYIPVSVIEKPIEERMASTIRHNRARGVHGVTPMTSIVAHLASHGWDDNKIAKHLGMDADEVLRLKQNSGLPSLFLNREFSKSWE